MKVKIFYSISLLLLCLSIGGSLSASAEAIQKHPRVAELEDNLRMQATNYLKARFPDRPFIITVSIDPLRRAQSIGAQTGESLPYFDSSSDEIQDEWDDPQLSLNQLMSRTNRITMEVSLSDKLDDDESKDLKDALFTTLHLIPARDEVKFSYKTWTTSSSRWMVPLIAVCICLVFLIGFALIQRISVQKLTRAFGDIKTNSTSGSPNPAVSMGSPVSASAGLGSGGTDHTQSIKGGVQVSDPIRAQEIIHRIVETLEKRKSFPTLKAMIELEEHGKRDPHGLGALLLELAPEMQVRLFSIGNSPCWFEAMNKPGMLTPSEIDLLQKISKDTDLDQSGEIELLKISCWRLGSKLSDFMRTIPRDTALSILSKLPKGIAINAARKAFPGAWADLLDPEFKPSVLETALVQDITKRAFAIRPLEDVSDFNRHRAEVELKDYLLTASPDEEREIYTASREDSKIHKIRTPFFKILDSNDENLKEFVPRYNPDQWAMALFNVPRSSRRVIQRHLSDKQNFLLLETLKRFDANNPEPKIVGQTRETMAQQFKHHLEQVAAALNAKMAETNAPTGKTDADENKDEEANDKAA